MSALAVGTPPIDAEPMPIMVKLDGRTFWKLGAIAERAKQRISDVLEELAIERVANEDGKDLSTVTPSQRRAIIALFELGWTDVDIAKALRYAPTTIRTHRTLMGVVRRPGRPSALEVER